MRLYGEAVYEGISLEPMYEKINISRNMFLNITDTMITVRFWSRILLSVTMFFMVYFYSAKDPIIKVDGYLLGYWTALWLGDLILGLAPDMLFEKFVLQVKTGAG